MHAFGKAIHAIATPSPFGGSIAAAVATPDFRSVRGLFSKAGLDPASIFATNGGPIKVAELDALLAKEHRGLSTVDRIALKRTLERLGLLVA